MNIFMQKYTSQYTIKQIKEKVHKLCQQYSVVFPLENQIGFHEFGSFLTFRYIPKDSGMKTFYGSYKMLLIANPDGTTTMVGTYGIPPWRFVVVLLAAVCIGYFVAGKFGAASLTTAACIVQAILHFVAIIALNKKSEIPSFILANLC